MEQSEQNPLQNPASSAPANAVPILKVMRLQAPELCQPIAGTLGTPPLPGPSLSLPDSFGVIHIGETFTAYLGALNPSLSIPIEGLTVMAQLQTPSRRFTLPSQMEALNSQGGAVVPPGQGVDAIVSRSLEEVGQHILRVEVGYANGTKTLRKFYRFHVASPLNIQELTLRAGYDCCFVSIAIENVTTSTSLTISGAEFIPPEGLEATCIDCPKLPSTKSIDGHRRTAVEMFDTCGRIVPGGSCRYLFSVKAESPDAKARGIGTGDVLGKAVFTWHKTMGEAGRIASTDVLCPPSHPPPVGSSGTNVWGKFVVHRSGLSVDVAASAADKGAGYSSTIRDDGLSMLGDLFPVTVDPIDPPSTLSLGKPQPVSLRVVNHTSSPLDLQFQMRLSQQAGVVVCGTSFKNLGDIGSNGGSAVVTVKILGLVAGVFSLQGCFLVDVNSGREFPIPPLFNMLVTC